MVPWYPATLANVFLSVKSFKQAPTAQVSRLGELDLDALATSLAKQYPGLPRTLHENYVLGTARAAYHFPVGTKLQIIITAHRAQVRPVGTDEMYVLWEQQPLKELI